MKRHHPSSQEIEEIEKLVLLGKQIASLAHELNNPLTAILGYAEMLQTIELDPRAKRYANNIYISAIRAAKIAEGLLTYLKKKEIQFAPVDINDVIEKTLSLFEYQITVNAIAIHLDLTPAKPVRGDFHKLQQIFFNLMINSIHSLETWNGKKQISIASMSYENKLRIFISDTGPGIDKTREDKIFSTIYTTKKNGSGLGLNIVYNIVKEHGGDITLLPAAEGCSFAIDFPIYIVTEAHHSITSVSKTTTENKKVLIVDDDELVISAIGGIIKLLGGTVTFTSKPSAGLKELKKNDFDIILVDYKMPEMNGVDFIDMASKFVDIKKFILMTGYIGLDIKKINEEYKIPVLQKPISLDELRQVISGDIFLKL
jgi:CheY-like chemotaxis protein